MDTPRFKRILLLDDDPGLVLALRLLLTTLSYEVTELTEPEKAIQLLQSDQPFDLFLCDLRMPRLNGMAMLAEAQRLRPTLPFLLMSAHATLADIEAATKAGARGFIAKPFTPEELAACLSKL